MQVHRSSSSHPIPVVPSSPDTHHSIHGRIVRFDNQCVLIPETHPHHRARLPFMVTKSVALPLWKKKGSLHASDDDPAAPDDPADRSEAHPIVFRVPLPSFKAAKSRSPTRTVDPDRVQPLHSCLVHRDTPSSPPLPQVARQSSLPLPARNVVTVPLRACCPDCVHITEECLKEGDNWQERFSSGARRRRSASLDHDPPPPRLSAFCSAASETFVPQGAFSGVLNISVDEIDRKRRSTDFLDGIPPEFLSDTAHDHHHHAHESSSSSGVSYVSSDDIKSSAAHIAPRIVEEDEDELFPLPSPRRTPSNSPKVSPSHSPGTSPLPSPNGSTASLRHSLSSRSDSPSMDAQASASDDSLGGSAKLGKRRRNRDERGLLTPDASPIVPHHVPSSYSSPLHYQVRPSALPTPEPSPVTTTTTTTTTSHDPGKLAFPRSSSNSLVPSVRSIPSSSNHHNRNNSNQPSSTTTTTSSHVRTVSSPVISTSFARKSSLMMSSPPRSPTLSRRTPANKNNASTPPTSPPSSPRSPMRKPRTSFSLLRVGADVLKGVSSIAGSPPS